MIKKTRILMYGIAVFLLMAGKPAIADEMRTAQISEMSGAVEIRIAGGEWQPATSEIVLHQTDEIRTGKGGFALILLDEGAAGSLELKEESHLKLNTLKLDSQSGDKTTLLDLAIGKVLVHAEKLRGDSKFEVRTPTATTGVRGTVFEVSVEEKE